MNLKDDLVKSVYASLIGLGYPADVSVDMIIIDPVIVQKAILILK